MGPLHFFQADHVGQIELHSSGLNKTEAREIAVLGEEHGHDFFAFQGGSCIGRPKKTISVPRYWCFNLQPRTIYCACTIRIRARNEEDPWEERLARKDTIEVWPLVPDGST